LSFYKARHLTIGDYINYTLLIIVSLICIFPFIYVFSMSFTAPEVYVPLKFSLLPAKWSLESYKFILSSNSFINSLNSTLFITVVGTCLNLVFTFTAAYGLSKKAMPGHSLFMKAVVFTLVFNAGILPAYILVKNVGLLNSLWSLIIPGLTNAWSLIVVKSFMESIPPELEESARIDGCNEIGVFFRIIIPLSKASLAAFALFFAVGHWNTYFNAMIYLTDTKKWTLQVLIKSMIIDSGSVGFGGGGDETILPQETIKMAAIILSILPILVVYPFVQKYFAQGVMIGAIKG